jgi:hypothetical protein
MLCLFMMISFSCNHNNDSMERLNDSRIKFIKRYEDGAIKSIVYFNKNQEKDSLGFWYYPDGQIEIYSEFLNGKNTGETVFYYPNGQVKGYFYYNTYGQALYHKKYTENGEVISEVGQPFYVFSNDDWDKVKPDEYLRFYVYTARPPNAKLRMLVEDKSETGKVDTLYNKEIGLTLPFLMSKFDKPGNRKIRIIGELLDTITGVIHRDTFSHRVTVISD